MQLLQKLLTKFNGLHYPQEYLCLDKGSFQYALHAYLVNDSQIIKDITNEHLFIGYNPLIFTFTSLVFDAQEPPDRIKIIFSQAALKPNDLLQKKDALALLSLNLIEKQAIADITICYYEGINGQHHFLSSFHQYIIGLNNRLYNKNAENIFLNNNLYKQVQIAYSIPRIISLITVSDGQLYNLFPTDLHGSINEQFYVSSLRHSGKACKQVEAAGRIVISQMHYSVYKTVYSLGKNHMQDLKPKENFIFNESLSNIFKLPLPKSLLHYRELELIGSYDYGIHKLLLYKIVSSQPAVKETSTLAHIHNCYATWRYNKKLPGDYLLR